MAWFQKWLDTLYQTFIVAQRYKVLIAGFKKTVIITIGALLIGVLIGTVIAIIKVLTEQRGNRGIFRILNAVCNLYFHVSVS